MKRYRIEVDGATIAPNAVLVEDPEGSIVDHAEHAVDKAEAVKAAVTTAVRETWEKAIGWLDSHRRLAVSGGDKPIEEAMLVAIGVLEFHSQDAAPQPPRAEVKAAANMAKLAAEQVDLPVEVQAGLDEQFFDLVGNEKPAVTSPWEKLREALRDALHAVEDLDPPKWEGVAFLEDRRGWLRCSGCGEGYKVAIQTTPIRYCPHCGAPITEWRAWKDEEEAT